MTLTAIKPFCLMRKTVYTLKPGTKQTWETTKAEDRMIDRETYDNIINAGPFFRRLGRSEYQERNYTPVGYMVTRVISKSPARDKKTIREFIFEEVL
jgi:hypothetical protein